VRAARIGIGGIEGAEAIVHQRGVLHIMGQHGDAIQRAAGGTRPLVLQRPLLGFSPTRPFSAAGTRPDPAVSVPSAKATSPAATATADPELDPPLI
jgi:hypothetical protein